MNVTPRIAVVGAGLVGRRHVELVAQGATLAAVVDPDPAAGVLAEKHGVPWFDDLATCLARCSPDGAVIATPNQMHVEHGLVCIDAGVPVLVEKPIADTSEGAEKLVETAEAAGIPLLVGHHRRHNPLITEAKSVIDAGRLGTLVVINAQFWICKPDDYFEPSWRRSKGAGPVFINLIHDIDLLRYLCGEVVHVQARESRNTRGFEVEDSAVILLEFENGALGTVSVSDAVPAPWSWELSAAENPAYPHVETQCYTIGGTLGSLSIPDLQLWHYDGPRGWWEPIASDRIASEIADPLCRQLSHFVDVILGTTTPLVSGREGLRTLRLVEAIKSAAQTGQGERP